MVIFLIKLYRATYLTATKFLCFLLRVQGTIKYIYLKKHKGNLVDSKVSQLTKVTELTGHEKV